MPLAKDAKSAIVDEYATHEGDTGSPEVQIALLTERIKSLTDHLRSFPKDVTLAAFQATNELYSEMSAKSPGFKKIYAHWSKFRAEQVMWQQFCDLPFDNMMSSLLRTKA